MLPIDKRKKALADSEWTVTITLDVKGTDPGVHRVLKYADSQLAKDPEGVGWLIARRMQETAMGISAPKRTPKRTPKQTRKK